jgi:hypothetical protein
MPELAVVPSRDEGNGPLVEGVTGGRLVGPNGSGPLVIFGMLGGLLAENRSGGRGCIGAFERGNADVACPFVTVGFT